MAIGRLSVRRFLGYGLLAVCALAWAAVAVVPFLNLGLGLGRGPAIATRLIIVGEDAFVIGVALLGKDILKAAKVLIDRLKRELRR